MKSSGIEAEHGGALGGVVNVVMKKGSNAYHGSLFATYESDGLDGSPGENLRYDPFPLLPLPTLIPSCTSRRKTTSGSVSPALPSAARSQRTVYGSSWDLRRNTLPDPEWWISLLRRTVTNVPLNLGNQLFTQDNQQYFTTARLDCDCDPEDPSLRFVALSVLARDRGAACPIRIRQPAF